MKKFPHAMLLLPLLLLGGCWQSKGSLYGGVAPVAPFAGGRLTLTGGGNPAQHFTFTHDGDGYRMIGADKDQDNSGDGFSLRFFALSGLPARTYVYEAVSLSHCGSPSGCDAIKADDLRYYGLVRATRRGAEEIRPDCEKDAAITTPLGIRADGGTCDFPTRAALEKSLLALLAGGKRPVYRYRLQ